MRKHSNIPKPGAGVRSAALLVLAAGCVAAAPPPAPKPIATADLKSETGVRSLAISPDGKLIAAGMSDGPVYLLEMPSVKQRFRLMKEPPASAECLAFAPDSSTLVVGVFAGEYQFWSTKDGSLRRTANGEGLAGAAAFSPEGKKLFTYPTSGGIGVFNASTGAKEAVRPFIGKAGERVPGETEFSRDASTLAVAGITDGDHSVALWDSRTAKLRRTFANAKLIDAMALSPDGGLLITGGQDGVVRVRNVGSGRELASWKGRGFVTAVALSSDGSRAAMSTDADPDVLVRETAGGKILARLPGHPDGARKIVFSPDGKIVVTAAASWLRLWRLPN